MKLRITFRELSILAGIMVAIVAISMLWLNEISGNLSLLSSPSGNQSPDNMDLSNLKILVSSLAIEILR